MIHDDDDDLNILVSQFVQNSLHWYKCKKCGHVMSKCNHSDICARRSETGHKDDLIKDQNIQMH